MNMCHSSARTGRIDIISGQLLCRLHRPVFSMHMPSPASLHRPAARLLHSVAALLRSTARSSGDTTSSSTSVVRFHMRGWTIVITERPDCFSCETNIGGVC